MEPRKRPYSDEEDTKTTKKRVLIGPNGSPHVNGIVAEQGEPAEGDNLELFRKEAIFRRMRHYSREHERSQVRIAELEHRKNTCELGLAAMSACWTQLVETIQLLVKPEEVSETKEGLFDFTIEDIPNPDYVKSLKNNLSATQTLVTRLVQLGGDSQPFCKEDAIKQCQKVSAESASLRSEMDIMRTRLRESESEKDKYHTALVAAESRLDRLRSGTVLAVQSRGTERQEAKEDVTEELPRKPSSPDPSNPPVGNGICDQDELEFSQAQVKSREMRILELEKETASLKFEKATLESELKLLSHDRIVENPHYKALLTYASTLEGNVKESREHISRVSDELGSLQATRKEWEESVIVAAGQTQQELRSMLTKRDGENARLRDQREQQAAELNERKHKDSVKAASLQELKALVDSRTERILVLESEISRHKAQLAAKAGNEDLMQFFVSGNIDNAAYIETLKDRVTVAENRAAALEQTLSIFQDDHPDVVGHMQAEADALQRLSEAEAQLKKYKAVYGDPSTLSPDTSKLVERLKQKDDEIQKLQLLDTQHNQAETSLYAELEKLSAAWEALDRQVKSKVFDLASMEERVTKSGLDRAKSENKFYAAMRDKEAIEVERKNLARNVEKQAKLLERLAEAEKNLTTQVSTLEKELVAMRRINDVHKDRVSSLEMEVYQWQRRADGEKRMVTEIRGYLSSRDKAFEAKGIEFRKLEDLLNRSKKELEAKLKERPVGHQKDNQVEELLKLLKCSTCQQNFRDTVITKCMHTFCKTCVDMRISTRQRKCPVDNLPFSQSDVQTFFFQ